MRSFLDLAPMDLLLLEVSLRAGLVLLAGWAAAQALRLLRASPATRHAVWTLAIGGSVALPFLWTVLPPLSLSAPWASPRMSAPVPTAELPAGPETARRLEAVAAAAPPVPAALDPSPATAPPQGLPDPAAAPLESGASPRAEPPWLFLVWLGGASLALVPPVLASFSLRRLALSSRRAAGGRTAAVLRSTMDGLGMKRELRVLESRIRSMPMTWGFRRPTILLPEQARRWPDDRLAAVMRHELAHIERRASLTQALAQAARAIYWFNPLSWLAAREMRALEEEACDDRAVSGGLHGPDYAAHLLAVAAECRPPVFSAGRAMARDASLERRLVSILKPRRDRRPITRRRFAAAAVIAAGLVSPLAVARLAPAEGAEPPAASPDPAASPQASPKEDPRAPEADLTGALGRLRAKIAEHQLTPIDEKEIVRGAIKGVISGLHDPYAEYLTPEAAAAMEGRLGGTLVGIGVHLEAHEGRIRVVTPLEDSPALHAGIAAGDVLLEIDGAPVAGLSLNDAVQRILGAPGTTVRLTVLGDDGRNFEAVMTRRSLQLPTVKGYRRGPDHRFQYLLDPARGIGYVEVVQFGSATPAELRRALESLQAEDMKALKALILDLRSCGGGLLDSAVAVARLFLRQGIIVSIHARSGEPVTVGADGSSILDEAPLVVLVSGQTASAAEIVAGALKDNGRALVLGTRTFGKGSVQSLIPLEEGNGVIKLTTARYRLPSGRDLERTSSATAWGIDPDQDCFIPITRDQLELREARRREREAIGRRPARDPVPGEVTPRRLEEAEGDPQLAAALKTLLARLETGRFETAGGSSPAAIEAFLKRQEVDRRRASLEKEIERLTRELAELEEEAPAKR